MNWIPVIINPSGGLKTAVLAELNQVFRNAGIRWSVEITQEEGDGVRFARRLVEQGAQIVAVYGGDGTISEVATGGAVTPPPWVIRGVNRRGISMFADF